MGFIEGEGRHQPTLFVSLWQTNAWGFISGTDASSNERALTRTLRLDRISASN
jgi:hypothetical protein